jgi:hypothetical protein
VVKRVCVGRQAFEDRACGVFTAKALWFLIRCVSLAVVGVLVWQLTGNGVRFSGRSFSE